MKRKMKYPLSIIMENKIKILNYNIIKFLYKIQIK